MSQKSIFPKIVYIIAGHLGEFEVILGYLKYPKRPQMTPNDPKWPQITTEYPKLPQIEA